MPKESTALSAVTREVVDGVVEEVEACFVEGTFTANFTIIETYHKIGEILRTTDAPITDLVKKVASKTQGKYKQLGERSLWSAVKLFDKYPDLNQLPGGKSITITKVKKLLEDPKEETLPEECLHEEVVITHKCKNCGKIL